LWIKKIKSWHKFVSGLIEASRKLIKDSRTGLRPLSSLHRFLLYKKSDGAIPSLLLNPVII